MAAAHPCLQVPSIGLHIERAERILPCKCIWLSAQKIHLGLSQSILGFAQQGVQRLCLVARLCKGEPGANWQETLIRNWPGHIMWPGLLAIFQSDCTNMLHHGKVT